MLKIFVDGGFEFGDAFKHAAADAIAGDEGEEAFDLVEPGTGRRREVHMEARMPFEPRFDLGMLVRGVVVGDQMHVEMGQRLGIDAAQEFEPSRSSAPSTRRAPPHWPSPAPSSGWPRAAEASGSAVPPLQHDPRQPEAYRAGGSCPVAGPRHRLP